MTARIRILWLLPLVLALVSAAPFGPVVPFEVSTGGVGVATAGSLPPSLSQRVRSSFTSRFAECARLPR